jgi:hypothetical protein
MEMGFLETNGCFYWRARKVKGEMNLKKYELLSNEMVVCHQSLVIRHAKIVL